MAAQSPKRSILVVGSANMDMVVSCDRFPSPGETIFGSAFGMYPGGKGANQAVACAKLGGRVAFLAKMGDDVFASRLEESLEEAGVDTAAVLTDATQPTGVALIMVDDSGENEIVVVSGSNMALARADIDENEHLFSEASYVLLQLEIPLETAERVVELAEQNNCRIILNPAPAARLAAPLLKRIDYLTPNESELELLTSGKTTDLESIEAAARQLISDGVGCVVVTLGARGALAVTSERVEHVPAVAVEAVDSTAAGDAFNGALAFALASEFELIDAVKFAGRVAALTVTRMGAQISMPTMDEVEAFQDDAVTTAR